MPERFEGLYRVKRAGGLPEPLTEQFFNLRFQDVDLRIAALEALDIAWQAALLQVRGEVLDRAEAVISDLRDQLVELTQLQWLTALSGTTVTLEANEVKSFAIDPDYRDLFTPGPFVLLSRAATADDYAVGRTISYDRASGQLDVEVIVITGNAGPHSDWVIAAIAGSTLAQLEMLEEARALQTAILAARDAAVTAASTATTKAAQTAADRTAVGDDRTAVGLDRATTVQARADAVAAATDAQNAAASIAGGPVASVASLTGVVSAAALKAALNSVSPSGAGLANRLAVFVDADGKVIAGKAGDAFAAIVGNKFGINTLTPGAELEVVDLSNDDDVRINLRSNAGNVSQIGASPGQMFVDAVGNKPFVVYVNNTIHTIFDTAGRLDIAGPLRIKSYTVANRPNAAIGEGTLIYVTNDPNGAGFYVVSGGAWKPVSAGKADKGFALCASVLF